MNDKRRDKPSQPGGGAKRSAPGGRSSRPRPGAKSDAPRRRDDATGGRFQGDNPKRSASGERPSRPWTAKRDAARGRDDAKGDRPRRSASEDRPSRPSKQNTDAPSRRHDAPGDAPGDRQADAAPSPPRDERTGGGQRPSFGGGKDRKPRREAPRQRPAPQQERTVERADDEARIAKVIARVGVCSRRDAEAWIAAGRVAVNGKVLSSPALNVSPQDAITIDGQPLAAREPTRLFLFHKPRGYVTTDRDPEGRPTIFSLLSEDLPRLVTIGRLDINTEGLLLLTNDGGLARVLELPATGWLRRYRVRARGETDQAALDRLRDGVTVDEVHYAGIEANLDRRQGANTWLTMGLREGKNREIKKVLETLGLEVNRLIRISFGPFQLGNLVEGTVEEVKTRVLRDQLGHELAREAGVDFDDLGTAPIVTQEVRRQRREERLNAVGREGRGGHEATRPPRRGGNFAEQRQDRPSRDRPSRDRPSQDRSSQDRPRQDRPKAAPRKHVSVIRAQQGERAAAGRNRIERAETADRKGRAVKVERVVKADRHPAHESARPRNARRFAQERTDAGASPQEGSPAGGRPGKAPGRKFAGGERTLRRKTPDRAPGRGGHSDGGNARPPRGKT